MSAWTIVPVTAPDELDDPAAWALHGAAAVSRAYESATWGYPDLAYDARYLAAQVRDQEYAIRLLAVAIPAGTANPTTDDVVALTIIILPRQENTHLAYIELYVHPEHVGRGVGTAMLSDAERLAAEHDRTTLIAWTAHAGEPDPGTPGIIEPPTGSGRIHPNEPGARFAQRNGYALEQAERYSVLHLPVDPALLDRLHDDAALRAGSDYRLHAWTDRTPEEWVDQVAVLENRMSTDAPTAGLEIEEVPWDAARVRVKEAEIADAGHNYLMVAAEHVPTRTLAAFTFVRCPVDDPGLVFQEDTLVLREHRGRRLGMLVKADLLRRLRDHRPEAARIHTWNAEENAYMLSINVALGFRPTGVNGMWQKKTAS